MCRTEEKWYFSRPLTIFNHPLTLYLQGPLQACSVYMLFLWLFSQASHAYNDTHNTHSLPVLTSQLQTVWMNTVISAQHLEMVKLNTHRWTALKHLSCTSCRCSPRLLTYPKHSFCRSCRISRFAVRFPFFPPAAIGLHSFFTQRENQLAKSNPFYTRDSLQSSIANE